MKIFALSEGAFTIDKSKIFVPFDIRNDKLNDRPIGSLLVEIQPFLIITTKDIIILDTGLGFSDENGQLQIHKNCKAVGVSPESVTKVLLSHLHKDHASGIKNIIGDLSFKNAIYYINKNELEFALNNESLSYVKDPLSDISKLPNVTLTDDVGIIDGYIFHEVTGGHSKFHQSFKIIENNETIFFGGDVAPQLQQMKSRFVAKYDLDGKKSMELRKLWMDQGKNENWTFLFYHDIKNPIFTFN